MNKALELHFDSLAELARWIDAHDRQPDAGSVSEVEGRGDDWCPMSYDETMALCRAGGHWPEGAEKMVAGVADAAALRENASQPMIENSVAGFMPDVPGYLAGVPDSMYAYNEGDMTVAQLPTVTIGIGTYSANTTSNAAMNRGIAVLSLIDAIEAVGYRVQLDYVFDCTGEDGGGTQKVRVTLKRSQDQWNPGSVAYAVANPGMLRRQGFALLERDPATVGRTQGGYGRGDDGYVEDYGLAFTYMRGDYGYETLEAALASVESKAADFGIEVQLTRGGA